MSLFKTSGIILKISKENPSLNLMDVFTYDFGKLKLKIKSSKKEKTLDIGYIINFEIKVATKSSISEIQNIKIKHQFDYQDNSFDIIHSYLQMIGCIYQQSPYHLPVYEVFGTYELFLKSQNNLGEKILLTHLKLLFIFGILWSEHPDSTIQKILLFTSRYHIKDILRLKINDPLILNNLWKLIT